MPEKNNVKEIGRILYVEPNDSGGVVKSVNGGEVSLTPDYSDMCISLRILVERVDRSGSVKMAVGTEDGGQTFVSGLGEGSFSSRRNEDFGDGYRTFYAKGTRVTNDSREFLTTYYADITAKDFKSEEKFEGFGITSVTISYESFYTPTVKMHIVDVRGCSLIGREEFIHDENGDITGDNLFGGLFQMPYPKFRLQVKGFYGRSVTYQLSCLDFQASFNSTTGNFEADVTFIGYEYGLLSDLPLRYIMAAPFCDYVGRDYWNNNVNTPRWGLGKDGSEKPITLSELARNIKKAMQENVPATATQEESERITYLNQYKSKLEDIKRGYDELSSESVKCYPIAFNFEDNDILTYVGRAGVSVPYFGDTQRDVALKKERMDYGVVDVSCYESKKVVIGSDFFHIAYVTEDDFRNLQEGRYDDTKSRYVFYDKDGSVAVSFYVYKWDDASQRINAKTIVNSIPILAEEFKSHKPKYINIPNQAGMLALVDLLNKSKVDKGFTFTKETFVSGVEGEISRVDAEIKKINDNVEKRSKSEKIDPLDVFKITPYIGNVFKLALCHLETFMHIMGTCVENINASPNLRQTSMLKGVETDVDDRIDVLPPFFNVVLERPVNDESGEDDDTVSVIGWPGNLDTGGNVLEEVKLVNALCVAAKKENMNNTDTIPDADYENGFYILPSDLQNQDITGMGVDTNNKDAVSCWFANRCASLFGICFSDASSTDAKAIGEIDALRYFSVGKSYSQSLLTLGDGKTEFSDFVGAVMNISKCSTNPVYEKYSNGSVDNGNNRYSFEIASNLVGVSDENRNPVFENDNGNYKYRYVNNSFGDGYVLQSLPSKITKDGIKGIVTCEKDNVTGKLFYKMVHSADDTDGGIGINCIYNVGTDNLFAHDPDIHGVVDKDNFLNSTMFEVYENFSVDNLFKKMTESESIKVNGAEVENGEGIKGVFRKYWKCGPDYYSEFFKAEDVDRSFAFYNEDVYDESRHGSISKELRGGGYDETRVNFDGRWYGADSPIRFNGEKWMFKAERADDVEEEKIIPNVSEIRLFAKNRDEQGNARYSSYPLFVSRHYCNQNGIVDEDERKKAKAYLFVMGLPFSSGDMVFDSERTGYVKKVPYGYALKIGAMLWRKRQDSDPIRFVDGTNRGMCGKDSTMLSESMSGNGYRRFVAYSKIDNFTTAGFSSVITGDLDKVVENRLVKLFEDFAKSDDFSTITGSLEVRSNEYGKFLDSDSLLALNAVIKQNWLSNKELAIQSIKTKTNLFENYDNISVDGSTGEITALRIRKGNPASSKIIEMMKRSVILAKASDVKMGKSGNVSVREDVFKGYLEGFYGMLKNLVGSVIGMEENVPEDGSETDDANKLNVYLLLKNLYDKWLTSKFRQKDGFDEFRVENFMENFVFIDTFYRNIGQRLHINLDKLLPSITGSSREAMLVKFFADIASQHNCMFFGMPDYTSFHIQEDDGKHNPIEWMNDIFTPFPYNRVGDAEQSNKFVIMYTHSPSKVGIDGNGSKRDCFDIINEATLPKVLKHSNGTLYDTTGRNVEKVRTIHSRDGFNIPAFGVVFGRQNNSIFKNVSVGMSNPTVTAQSLQALANIADKGQVGTRVRYTYGQDLYTVYSGYSYTCEVEMMGCAQIVPLMYFQLTNIPLFNGTYMIFSVEHQMTPGNMITKFKGIKICRYAFPFAHDWFSKDNPWAGTELYSRKDEYFDICEDDVSKKGCADCDEYLEKKTK